MTVKKHGRSKVGKAMMEVDTDIPQGHLDDFMRRTSGGLNYALTHGYEFLDGSTSVLNLVAEQLQIDLHPLHVFAGPEWGVAEFVEAGGDFSEAGRRRAAQAWKSYIEERETKWQPLEAVLNSIDTLIQALDNHPNIFVELNGDTYDHGDYFTDGTFREDLEDLRRMLVWTQEHGAQKVRLRTIEY
jgi:hypothetical protein